MKRLLLLALAGFSALAFSGCNGTYYGGYSEGGPAYGYDGGSEVFIQRDNVYVNGGYYDVPIYRYGDRVYYVYEGHRHYFSDSDRYKYWHGHDHHDNDHHSDHHNSYNDYAKKQYEYQSRQKYAENQQKIDQYRLNQELKEKQARNSYEVQRKQYQLDQRVAGNRLQAQKTVYKNNQELAKKNYAYQQKVAEARQKQAVAEWKAKNGATKKKKKDND